MDAPEMADSPPRLRLAAVTKTFRSAGNDVRVIDGVDLTARRGEFVSILGPSGCGKSTLLAIAAGLEVPTSGAVVVDGVPVTGHTESFAYMPQKDLLFPWRRLLDNAALGLQVQGARRQAARARAAELFEQFGLAGFERAYPFELSGGMRQRAALLRTVVQQRPVLLLDEPFGALDSLTRTDLQVWLEQVWLAGRWTVLLITHDIREAIYLSDTIVVLTPRPARVRTTITVGLERPRSLDMITSPEFAKLEAQLLAALHS